MSGNDLFLLLTCALVQVACDQGSLGEPAALDPPDTEEDGSVAELVRREFESVVIPRMVCDESDPVDVLAFVFHRANELHSEDPARWMFGYSFSRPSNSIDGLMQHESASPGAEIPSPVPTITGKFENITALDALEMLCDRSGFTYTITELGRFEIVDANSYSR